MSVMKPMRTGLIFAMEAASVSCTISSGRWQTRSRQGNRLKMYGLNHTRTHAHKHRVGQINGLSKVSEFCLEKV